jgi:protein FrlC
MKFAQSSAVYFNYSLPYAIKDLGELGYDGVEIWGGRPHMYKNDLDFEINQIKDMLKKFNMDICNFIPAQFRYPSILCSQNEIVRKDSINYIKSAIDNAKKLGSPSVSLCPGMVLFDQEINIGWENLIKSFEELEEYAKDKNILLFIEPAHRFETNLILTIEDCLRMLEILDSDIFGILIDTGHCYLNGEDFEEILPKCKGYPLHFHIDDNFGDSDSHLIPGEGSINFKELVRALQSIDYKGYVSAELGSSYIMDSHNACKKTLTKLKEIF